MKAVLHNEVTVLLYLFKARVKKSQSSSHILKIRSLLFSLLIDLCVYFTTVEFIPQHPVMISL